LKYKIINKIKINNTFIFFLIFKVDDIMSFLSQSDISQLLECEICNLKYDINDIPKIIPCGKTACLKCMSKINENSTYFKCLNVECTEEHSIPRYGFPINKKILDLIAIIKVKRIPVIKPLELNMDYIRSIIIEISNDLDEGNNKIKKYCNELKRQVLVTTEEKIKNLQELSESLVEIINDYENTCIQRYNSSRTTKFKKKMEKILKGANKFIQDRTEYLNQLEINENEVNISIELAKEYKEFLDKQKMNIEGLIFDNKLLEFKINLSRLEETSIGFISSKQFEISALNFDEELEETFKEKSEKSISCENTIIISGCWDNTIKLWDSKTGECLNTLDSHDGVVFCLQLIDDDKLASGSSDEKIKIWNINTGDCIKTFKGHTSSVICLQLIPDETPNEILVSGSWDKTIKLWNLKEGELLNTLIGHDNGIMSIQVVSKQTLISASSDSKIKIWDLVTGHCLKTLHGHTV
jgi:WD40 repeat protein